MGIFDWLFGEKKTISKEEVKKPKKKTTSKPKKEVKKDDNSDTLETRVLSSNLHRPDGSPIMTFENKPFTGIEYSLFNNGQLVCERNYVDGMWNGFSRFWYENGQKSREGNYINNEQNGLHTDWDENGNLESEIEYLNDEYHGFYKYYENGKLTSEEYYNNGEEDGCSKTWYENGQLHEEYYSKDGSLINNYLSFHENGEKKKEIVVDDKHINITRWYDNGKKREVCQYKNENRRVLYKRIDDDFTIVQHKEWNKKGELIQDIDNSKSKMTDEEVEKILLLIDSTLSKNPLYEIVKKRGEIISKSPNIYTDTKLEIDRWISGHYEEYEVQNDSKEDSIFKYKNYLEIHNTINKYIQSNYTDKDDSKKLQELVFLRMSSYSSLEGVRRYLMISHNVFDVEGKKI